MKLTDLVDIFAGVFFTDGLDISAALERYQLRRHQLKKQFRGPIVLRGVQDDIASQYHWLQLDQQLVQDPVFLYFSGLNQYNSAMILNDEGDDILFLTPKNEEKAFWEGSDICFDEEINLNLAQWLGFDRICLINDLFLELEDVLSKHASSSLYSMWHVNTSQHEPVKPDYYTSFKLELQAYIAQSKLKSVQLLSIEPFTYKRLQLDAPDLANMEQAIDITVDAFKQAMHTFQQFETETEVAGYLKGYIQQRSWLGISFPPIVASGQHATVLHYKKNNAVLKKDSLLLIDFGCRCHAVVSDLSRTIPVNGRFNPLQSLLYQIVLDAQRLVEEKVRPGVTFHDLNELCWSFIENALQVRFVLPGGTFKRAYKQRPHNVGHFIGHSVHDGDPFRHYSSFPFNAGMVITNEPGLYGHFEMVIDDELYSQYCGIRIEDQLLVTSDGCRNLSTSCPKSIDEIEALMSSSS